MESLGEENLCLSQQLYYVSQPVMLSYLMSLETFANDTVASPVAAARSCTNLDSGDTHIMKSLQEKSHMVRVHLVQFTLLIIYFHSAQACLQ